MAPKMEVFYNPQTMFAHRHTMNQSLSGAEYHAASGTYHVHNTIIACWGSPSGWTQGRTLTDREYKILSAVPDDPTIAWGSFSNFVTSIISRHLNALMTCLGEATGVEAGQVMRLTTTPSTRPMFQHTDYLHRWRMSANEWFPLNLGLLPTIAWFETRPGGNYDGS